ncbi:prephenate dehydrogenase [Micromonospora mirobrigensis]|uniref:Prephenate dehydrogenase n=1 Tax=Micromonospora mirobrigensis TaxID=262898 RepID=A0A1C4XX20_9ACTN|nr:prephenate dehydrogenase/arogenate dehydrogenase family protein [Micromonospora mirobrigensis]SCF12982.1 prephenate dehydrogenase [Micromonospora mirobrigensis]
MGDGGTGAPPRAAVVGTGLIGGSVLLRLRQAGLDVAAWDPDPATRALARDRGLASPDTIAQAVAGRDVVFLCGPLPTLTATLAQVAAVTGPDCVLTDVGSTKRAVAAFAAAHGLAGRFVPGHPMAGTERAGLAAASPDLFTGAAWVLCPDPAGIGRFRVLTALLREVFRARVVPMDAVVHDRVVALSSHVPHLLAGGLAGAVDASPVRDAVLSLAAGSFRDGTRVAGTPAPRTANMLLDNRDEVLAQLDEVRAALDELATALRRDDRAALVAGYQRAATARAAVAAAGSRPVRADFPLDADPADEVAWLCDLGTAGGHLTDCRVAGGVVAYRGLRPA